MRRIGAPLLLLLLLLFLLLPAAAQNFPLDRPFKASVTRATSAWGEGSTADAILESGVTRLRNF